MGFVKNKIAFAVVVLLTSFAAIAQNWQISPSALLYGEDSLLNILRVSNKYTCVRYTADAAPIKTGSGILGRVIITGGTSATAILYDNTAASGTQIINVQATTISTGGPVTVEVGGAFATGLTLDMGGTSPEMTVCYL